MKGKTSLALGFIFSVALQTLNAQNSLPDSLQNMRNIKLDEVVVTAITASKETPVAYTNVSKEEVGKRNFGKDIPHLLSQTPSVIVTSDAGTGIGYTGFRVRGTDANRINITVNGVPVNDSESHTVFWVNMPDFASSVENVQIQRGAGTSTNGAAAFGATVSMQTLGLQSKPYAEVSSSAGSFNTFKNTFMGGTGLINNHFVFDARYTKISSDGFIDRASANMDSYYASAAYYGQTTKLKFQTFGSSEKTYQAWTGIPSYMLDENRTYNPCGEYVENGETKYYDNQTDNYNQQHYHLMLTQLLGNGWDLNATLHYTRGKGYYEDYKADAKFSSYKLPSFIDAEGQEVKRSDLVRRKWLDNHFYGVVANTTYTADRLQLTMGAAASRYNGDHYGKVIWAKNAQNLPVDHEYYRSKGDKTDYNAFAKANIHLLDGLNGYIDLQYRGIHYTIKGEDDKAGMLDITKNYNFFNPKVGLNYTINEKHSTYASFAVANREPNRNNFTEAAANERPTHETLYDYEAGYKFASSIFQAGVNMYFMDYTNQLILTGKISEIGEALTSNIKDSYRMGIELSAAVQPLSWLHWSGNATFSRNRIKNFTEFVDDWDTGEQREQHLGDVNIAFSPDVIANSNFTFIYKNFDASFMSTYVGKQYIDNTSSNDRKINPYFVNNLQLGYTFKPSFMKEIRVDFAVNNIFNAKYETNAWVYSYYEGGERKKDDGYFTQAGTNVMGRVVLRF